MLQSAYITLAVLLATPPVPDLTTVVGENARLVVTLTGGQSGLDEFHASEFLAHLQELPGFAQSMKAKGIREARTGLRFIAGTLGRSEWETAGAMLGRETVVGLREPSEAGDDPEFLAVVRAESVELAARLEELIHQLTTLAGRDGDATEEDGVRSANGELFTARAGDRVFLSNAPHWLAAAWKVATSPAIAPSAGARMRARVDLAGLRALGLVDHVPARFDNALAPLLFQGVFAAFEQGAQVEAELHIGRGGLRGALTLPAPATFPDGHWTSPQSGAIMTPPPGVAAYLRVRRDFAAFYERRFDLLLPELEGKILEFENIFSLFLGGRSFGDELLPALGDDALLVFSEPEFPGLDTPPMIQLPAFALITPFQSDRLRPDDLIVAFQTVVGVVNADRAQNGEAPLMIRTEVADGVTVAMAHYLPPMDTAARPEIRYNASPAVAVVNGHLILASSTPQLKDLITALGAPGPVDGGAGTEFSLDLARAAAMLILNREALIAKRVVEDDERPAEAGAKIDAFAELLSGFGALDIRLHQGDDGARIEFSIALRDGQTEESDG